MSIKHFQLSDRISGIALFAAVFLGMLAFIPGGFVSGGALKGYLLVVTVLVSFVAWLVARLIEGSFHIPWTPIHGAGVLLVVVLFISSLFSNASYLSFFGEGFDSSTFAVIGSLVLAVFLASVQFSSRERVFYFFRAFFFAYVILALYQIVHIFLPDLTSFGVFYGKASTPVGSWSDFSFLSGAALIGSVLVLQFLKPKRFLRILAISGAVLSLLFVILTNIFTVWILVGISSMAILIYTLTVNRLVENRPFPFMTFALSLISLFFILANGLVGGSLASLLGVSFAEAHPSFSATIQVGLSSLRENPVLGAGPNHFLTEWITRRPVIVNQHSLWDTPFTSGSSFFLTIGVLSGALGILAVLFFLLTYFYQSGRTVFSKAFNTENGIYIFSMFLVSLYFMLSVILYSPGIAVIISAFIFLGIFLGTLVGENLIPVRHISFLKDTRAGFFSILAIVTLLMVSAGTAYSATGRFASLVFFQKGLVRAQMGELDVASARMGQAISLNAIPLYYRAQVFIAEQSIRQTTSLQQGSVSEDQVRSALQNAVALGNNAARAAITLDATDPTNHIVLGDFLRLISPLKVEGSFEAAEQAYNNAIELAPRYPKPYFGLAQLYYENEDTAKARTFAQKALDEKPNYTAVFSLLAQIDSSAGNTSAAVRHLQNATMLDPNNADIYFQLGFLRYSTNSYTEAVAAFRRAVTLSPQYINAWYYLALANQKIGANAEATSILTALRNKFPENTDISAALSKSSTLVDTKPSEEVKPEDDKKPTAPAKKAN
jgi:tetratricopeptide (TPR) repeat protein